MPAISTIASVKPRPPKIGSVSDSVSPSCPHHLLHDEQQAKRIAQLVVISGRKTPKLL